MGDRLRVPGPRDVVVSRDGEEHADAVVVACPPHPQLGGSRSDSRLRAVSAWLTARGVACCRLDYGAWAEGTGEIADARRTVDWARERYGRVGLFGYSFGASIALLAATDDNIAAVSALAPDATLESDGDVVAAIDDIACPVQILHGERDSTVDWEPVVSAARERGHAVATVPGTHQFGGQLDAVATRVGQFLCEHCLQ